MNLTHRNYTQMSFFYPLETIEFLQHLPISIDHNSTKKRQWYTFDLFKNYIRKINRFGTCIHNDSNMHICHKNTFIYEH